MDTFMASPYVIAITGASGTLYATRLIEFFLKEKREAHLLISKPGRMVFHQELGVALGDSNIKGKLETFFGKPFSKYIQYEEYTNWNAAIASGSYPTAGMVIVPCSMSTLGAIANGTIRNVIDRAADICLKEQRRLVIVPRETPLDAIHLENMLKLARLGVSILPPMPAFYNHPQSIQDQVDFVVGRILDLLRIPNHLYPRWKS